MPIDHVAQPGECITSISDQHGFYWQTIWDHSQNAELKELRKDPNTLVPGDVVHVPDKREKKIPVQTGAKHKFQKPGIPAVVRLQLFDGEDYRARQDYTFVIEGKTHTGVTDHEGVLQVHVAPSVRKGTLIIGPDNEEYEFDFGHLPPEETVSGVKARLQNLGFYSGRIDDELDEVTRDAIRAFQQRFDLPETGEADQSTREKLVSVHDSVNEFPDDEAEPASGPTRSVPA